ncbi:uncharacterized protein AB675_2879 [Cyphellophora attinorum]|uniref:Uncharacterized protein n=1 Tax=Cyphellophora attinorum TaxID=1664694 RepID=A0A0N1HGV3_9EURO|nr:uncharacterized protein AB675_2879 [Phialophora attinorum]KPI45024.1 hypothetical protein AB675_2879 [Phialophora attinorum]
MPSSSPMSSLTPVPPDSHHDTQGWPYRDTQEIPSQLNQHLHAYYEEDLNAQAFDFLHSIVSNSVSPHNPAAKVFIPPSPQIALAATLAVHPNTTTRSEDRSRHAQNISAFKLLRLLINVTGPYTPFQKAFRFRKYQDFFHTTKEVSEETYVDTRHQYAGTNNLFNRADDFWALIGWAFNCACLPDMYAERWKYYEPLLDLLIQILEIDYVYCHAKEAWEDSLLWSYVELASGGYGKSRRIFRAIFASGTTRDLNEFREIFNKELKRPKVKEEIADRKIDLDNDEFADYDSSSDEFSETEDTRPNKRARRTRSARSSTVSLHSAYEADASSTAATLGSPTALRLRTRLLRLLAALATQPSLIAHSSSAFVAEDELYTLFVEFISPLPLPIFQQIILPDTHTSAPFDRQTHIAMCEAILARMLESQAPKNDNADGSLDASRLVQCYLPYAASSTDFESQARVALCVEALARLLDRSGALVDPEQNGGVDAQIVGWAVEEGVRRRLEVALRSVDGRKAGKKGSNTKKDEDRVVLRESSERLRVLVQTDVRH